ncbi:hypothetical protein LSCM4_00299 [Leishmania orientalis]|uniref:Uncharacterized protein n=1 Tax=Leishmania orientalis TaxID=2249476 RepID=A0A836KBL6_9TRYP|nr:hypothetical protein LSCM4_00299 [Leishmania orientalis]
MRPSLIQCFPHPFTRQWPATGNPATCECRQLYALVSVCCCVPNTHLLVLHESAHLNTNLITSMPKGPKYVDFVITPHTTPEDLCGFLVRAENAATGLPFTASPGSGGALGAPNLEEFSVFSPASPGESRHEALAATAASTGASNIRHQSPLLSCSTAAQRQAVVVCLHGIADASAAVQSSLMDVLMFEQVRNHHRAVRVPTLRIVAFCSSRNYAILLPEPLRALFTLSTYVSTLASDSAVVLQTATASSSSIVNKRFMLEVMTTSDGQSLLETVTLSGSVKRYLRHLLLVLRGSFAAGMSPGALSLRRLPRWMTILKALAILFMPDEELLRSRSPQARSVWLQSFTRATPSMTFERTTQTATHRAPTPVHRSTSYETRAAHQQPGGSQSESRGRRQAGDAAAAAEECSNGTKSGAGDIMAIESFSNVVVSPSDIACVLHCLVGHMMTLPREMVPSEEILSATSTMMGNAAGSSSLVDAYGRMLDTNRQGNVGFSLQDPAMWDAVAASWTLRNLHGIANPTVDPASGLDNSVISNGVHRTYSMTLYSLESGEVIGESDWGLHRGHGTWLGDSSEQEALAASPHASHEQYFQTLNNRPLLSVAEAWKWTAVNKLSILDVASTPTLDYWEVREVMRATLLCRSAPAPG